ncbi:hypothetical protein DFJ77DRAFT_427481 [Powellomyces hirtus]|nr:hypothetical protein DFJ77DRAFT_427481 [Powellomyces hirtus]
MTPPISDIPIRTLTDTTLALLTTHPSSAVAHAGALVDHAHEQLHSVAFRSVSPADRAAFTQASLLKAVALLTTGVVRGGESGVVGERAGRRVVMREALKVLDTALLMAGRPCYEEVVMRLVQVLSACLEQEDERTAQRSLYRLPPNLPAQSPLPTIKHPVPTHPTPPSLYTFAQHLSLRPTPTPLLMKHAVAHWPACSTRPWADLAYLAATAGTDRTVPIEVGGKYTDAAWTQRLVTFGELLDMCVGQPSESHPPPTAANEDPTARTRAPPPPPPIAYLAQHDLFSQIPRLRDDILVPDYCFVHPAPPPPPTKTASTTDDSDSASDSASPDNEADVKVNAWLGPRGTVSPLHHDPHNNLFAQVVGRKYIRCYDPAYSRNVYPHDDASMMSNTSRVDVEAPDVNAFPDFPATPYLECIVEPGDLLFIPRGWWHYVRSLELSFSVSFWF